jgi:AAA domain (dynein-related subfamily)/CbbQ/NirQ/NorQ C-terminal
MKKSKKVMRKVSRKVLSNLAKARAARAAKKTKTVRKPVGKKVKDFTEGFTNEVYKPIQVGKSFAMLTTDDQTVAKLPGVSRARVKQAHTEGKALRGYVNSKGKTTYRMVDMSEFKKVANTITDAGSDSVAESFDSHESLKTFIHEKGLELKPEGLFMDPLKWKYLIRSAVRGKNIMMTGPTGCGKTLAAQSLVKSLNRPDFYFNLGATQDPRATLIGNTHFNKEKGTFFSESAFVKAISTPNAIILLDEISRAHPEAHNILMTVLDYGQRYLRLDEAEGSPIVKVAPGVTFIATANIGNEYTATRVMDRALFDRFVTIEMNLLDKVAEYQLLKFKFADADDYALQSLAEIAHTTRELVKTDVNKISTIVSTRVNVEAAGLVYDGFTLMEAAEIAILPYFSNDGGLDSERTFMKQLVQKFVKTTDDGLYTEPTETKDDDAQITW